MNKYKKKDAPPSDCNGDRVVTIIEWTITSEPSKPSLSSVEKMMKIIMLFNELKFSVCLPQFSSATVPKVN